MGEKSLIFFFKNFFLVSLFSFLGMYFKSVITEWPLNVTYRIFLFFFLEKEKSFSLSYLK